ncbi:Pyridoxamine 5'-phosphate oxidase (PNP/PMP oxidase) (PNPOx) [Legionella lansingensis]|uniref:Pyridoxamine 5'-phosphate oxidase n=1 Tax=Legionella lansingensis TaxID=45067 RepID=A0A0W0VTX2_9GAMM|nr:pyridoxamine 5'-phosphate oxidase family protein [Legionella lansingensis]KTD23519.1 pyridoxamine 5'-phosphate oxidase [Legionella lansingensis]SNV52065.1 Pyridoxamine 5'-phosphate oxidase (PNP/PMP oxidase) (PNPOx) [Legionella lansingensis]
MPFHLIADWLAQEAKAGSVSPDRAVLSTVTSAGIPHSRVVAIKTVENESVLFFTQRGTRKFVELTENPQVSMTFWFAMQQRQIILEGIAKPLSLQDNEAYWQALPRERQLRFSAYAPTSGKPIVSLVELEENLEKLKKQYQDSLSLPLSEFYRGFRVIPDTLYFYTLGSESFSESIKYSKNTTGWHQQLLSP